jgi:Zn-dependent protease
MLLGVIWGVFEWITWKEYELSDKAWFVLNALWYINLVWPVLNLFPIWPLDGGQICRELFTWFSRKNGVRVSLMLSVAVS